MNGSASTRSTGDLDKIAKQILDAAKSVKFIAFTGEMGAGKTTLINRLCRQLETDGFQGSPSFSLVNEYVLPDNTMIYHFDCFRISDESEILDIGWEDYLNRNAWIFIEWPEKIKNLLPLHFLWVDIRKDENENRRIVWKML